MAFERYPLLSLHGVGIGEEEEEEEEAPTRTTEF